MNYRFIILFHSILSIHLNVILSFDNIMRSLAKIIIITKINLKPSNTLIKFAEIFNERFY